MLAREPEGAVRFEVERVASEAPATSRLRIRIEPFVEIREGRLSYDLPEGIELEPVDDDLARIVELAGQGADETRRAAIALGTLHAPRVMQFAVIGSTAPGQIPLRFELVGRRVDGTELRTTLNVPLAPEEPAPGRLVNGAWQFDAGSLDGPQP